MNVSNLSSQPSTVSVRMAAAVLSAVASLVAVGCSSHAAPAAMPPPPEVGVAQVLSRPVRPWDDFTGRIAAVETVDLRPRVSGYVDRVAYHEGDEVRKGELLFAIDQRPYRAALARAEAELERARSEARLAQTQSKRAQTLIDAKAISREEFDTRSAAAAQGNASVRATEAAVTTARLDLTFTEVRAPIDGRAGRAMVTQGNLAQADSTLLTTLVSQDPMYVYFESDEQTYLRYNALARSGQRDSHDNPVRVGLADQTDYPYTGTIDFTDNRVDPATGTIRIRAVLPNPQHALTPGLFARVELQGAAAFDALLIDDKAVLTDQDRKFVYVLGAEDKAQRKDVVLGRAVDGLRIVDKGLQAGDKVIVSGVQKVFMPGMAVKPDLVAMDAEHATQAVAKVP